MFSLCEEKTRETHMRNVFPITSKASFVCFLLLLLGLLVIQTLKSSRKTRQKDSNQFSFNGHFINRSSNLNGLCYVLAGHKRFLWNYTLPRIAKSAPSWMDICVITSGIYSPELDHYCSRYNWSYLTTRENNIGLIQNVAIDLHPAAQYIFKLDEDIFITDNYFNRMIASYRHSEQGNFSVGVLAPMITINCYTSRIILERFNCLEQFQNQFQRLIFEYNETGPMRRNPEISMFFWGKGNCLPPLDKMDEIVREDAVIEKPSPIRFNIGAILYKRELWKDMGYFQVDRKHRNAGMGTDEVKLNQFCFMSSRVIMISYNIIVGHFSYRPQTEVTRQFLERNPDRFTG